MTKRFKKQSPLWTLMSDMGFQLFAVLCILVSQAKTHLVDIERVLAQRTQEVAGLHVETRGLQGQLEIAETELANYAETGAEQQGIIVELTKEVGEKGEQIGQLTAQWNKLRPSGPIDIVFIIDCSQSMEIHHDRLRSAQKSLVRIVSRLSSDCRISVLGIRNGVVYRSPLKPIESPYVDNGTSRDELLRFMDEMDTASSHISHQQAIADAIGMLSAEHASTRKQAILILGDVGPSELDGHAGRSASESAMAKEMLEAIRLWVGVGQRSVGTIYVGSDPSSPDGKWFRDLSHPSSQNFSTDSTELFSMLLQIIEQN